MPREDQAIIAAAAKNRLHGLTGFQLGDIEAGRKAMDDGDYRADLRRVADKIGRTYLAVRKRAERIGAISYRPRRPRE